MPPPLKRRGSKKAVTTSTWTELFQRVGPGLVMSVVQGALSTGSVVPAIAGAAVQYITSSSENNSTKTTSSTALLAESVVPAIASAAVHYMQSSSETKTSATPSKSIKKSSTENKANKKGINNTHLKSSQLKFDSERKTGSKKSNTENKANKKEIKKTHLKSAQLKSDSESNTESEKSNTENQANKKEIKSTHLESSQLKSYPESNIKSEKSNIKNKANKNENKNTHLKSNQLKSDSESNTESEESNTENKTNKKENKKTHLECSQLKSDSESNTESEESNTENQANKKEIKNTHLECSQLKSDSESNTESEESNTENQLNKKEIKSTHFESSQLKSDSESNTESEKSNTKAAEMYAAKAKKVNRNFDNDFTNYAFSPLDYENNCPLNQDRSNESVSDNAAYSVGSPFEHLDKDETTVRLLITGLPKHVCEQQIIEKMTWYSVLVLSVVPISRGSQKRNLFLVEIPDYQESHVLSIKTFLGYDIRVEKYLDQEICRKCQTLNHSEAFCPNQDKNTDFGCNLDTYTSSLTTADATSKNTADNVKNIEKNCTNSVQTIPNVRETPEILEEILQITKPLLELKEEVEIKHKVQFREEPGNYVTIEGVPLEISIEKITNYLDRIGFSVTYLYRLENKNRKNISSLAFKLPKREAHIFSLRCCLGYKVRVRKYQREDYICHTVKGETNNQTRYDTFKSIDVLIRYMPMDISEEAIAENLKRKGFHPMALNTAVIKRKGELERVVLVKLPIEEERIYGLSCILGYSIIVEELLPNTLNSHLCNKCLQFGHSDAECSESLLAELKDIIRERNTESPKPKIKVVIKGIPVAVSEKLVLDELKLRGFSPVAIQRMELNNQKFPMCLVHVSQKKSILKMTCLLGFKIKIEPYCPYKDEGLALRAEEKKDTNKPLEVWRDEESQKLRYCDKLSKVSIGDASTNTDNINTGKDDAHTLYQKIRDLINKMGIFLFNLDMLIPEEHVENYSESPKLSELITTFLDSMIEIIQKTVTYIIDIPDLPGVTTHALNEQIHLLEELKDMKEAWKLSEIRGKLRQSTWDEKNFPTLDETAIHFSS